MDDVDVNVARKIRNRRIELGLRQIDMANRLKITRGNISHMEMGRNKINHNDLKKISEILGKPVSYFLDSEEEYLDTVQVNKSSKELKRIIEKWGIENFLNQKKVPKEFKEDLKLHIEYLCELYGIDLKNVW